MGAGWKHGPASGKPASGTPARGGPKAGAGWGGGAKGASASRLASKGDDYSDAVRALARDPDHVEGKVALRQLYLQTLVNVAVEGEAEQARVAAADKLADRVDGKATQRSDVTSKGERLASITVVTGVERAGD